MRVVGDYVGHQPDPRKYQTHPLVTSEHLVGVEFEVEHVFSRDPMTYWDLVEDGSLRNMGMEYVLKYPMTGADLFSAMRELDARFRATSPRVNVRCSTHVHLDARDLTVDQLTKLLLVYVVFERALYKLAGKRRKDSVFCVPLYRGRGALDWVLRPLSVGRDSRYTGVSMAALQQHGTLEFRMLEGTTSVGRVLKWVNLITAMKDFVLRHEGSYVDLSRTLRDLGAEQSATHVFGRASRFLLPAMTPGICAEGLRLCKDVLLRDEYEGVELGPTCEVNPIWERLTGVSAQPAPPPEPTDEYEEHEYLVDIEEALFDEEDV